MADWADRTAQQILILAFCDPNAREQIAQLLLIAHQQGKLAGIEEARQVMNQTFADHRAGRI